MLADTIVVDLNVRSHRNLLEDYEMLLDPSQENIPSKEQSLTGSIQKQCPTNL